MGAIVNKENTCEFIRPWRRLRNTSFGKDVNKLSEILSNNVSGVKKN